MKLLGLSEARNARRVRVLFTVVACLAAVGCETRPVDTPVARQALSGGLLHSGIQDEVTIGGTVALSGSGQLD